MTFFSKLRRYLADRRRGLRFPLSRRVEVMAGVSGDAMRLSLFCNTIDLGEEGMSVLVGASALSLFEAWEGQQLRVVLSLPDGPTTFEASPVNFRPASRGKRGRGYALGLRITGAGEGDRKRLRAFLRGLRRTSSWKRISSKGPAPFQLPTIQPPIHPEWYRRALRRAVGHHAIRQPAPARRVVTVPVVPDGPPLHS